MTQFVRAATTKLTADKRKAIAIQALARSASISALAADNGVSRPLIYREVDKARAALDDAFSPTQTDDADKVIFMLPVTRRWLDQTMLGLTQIARASFRGVIEFMHDILGISVSLGTVHNVHQWAAQRARAINDNIDLSTIRVGLHDEIFQGSQPVLVGVDVGSTYGYLLAPEAHRDGDTWAIHLLDLQKQGLVPEYTIADAGTGLRAGQRIAWPDTPCHGDVFHILQQFKALANIRTRIASGTRSKREELETRLANPRRRCEDSLLVATLEALHREEAREHQLASDLRTLAQWLERDILSLAGPDAAQRQMLYDFVVDELLQRESEDLSRIGTLRRALQNQQDNLLAFVRVLDEKFDAIARNQGVSADLVRATCVLHRKPETSTAFWQGWNRLFAAMGSKFHAVYDAVSQAMQDTPRSSSLVENLNSRTRTCLSMRRHLSGGRTWLGLLQFTFNHRRFVRSRCAYRVGKSPREVMTGQSHPHWLTLLGLGPLQPKRI